MCNSRMKGFFFSFRAVESYVGVEFNRELHIVGVDVEGPPSRRKREKSL